MNDLDPEDVMTIHVSRDGAYARAFIDRTQFSSSPLTISYDENGQLATLLPTGTWLTAPTWMQLADKIARQLMLVGRATIFTEEPATEGLPRGWLGTNQGRPRPYFRRLY